MLTIGERMVNEPLNYTSISMDYLNFHFTCKLEKGYGSNLSINYRFIFSDGSEALYNKSSETLIKTKNYGQSSKFELEDAQFLFANRLKRIMMYSNQQGYIAKGRYADYDNNACQPGYPYVYIK